MAHPVSPVILRGGMKEILIDFSQKQYANLELVFILLISIGLIFSSNIPSHIRQQLSSTLGRTVLFGTLVGILYYTKWVAGILFALLIAVILSTRSSDEAMSDYSVQLVDNKKRWFVETVLNENPIAIQDEKVKTQPVQDYEQNTNSRTQDTKSSSR